VDGLVRRSHHSGQDEVSFLVLPCDWRFLPKLGPLRLWRAGLSLSSLTRFACRAISVAAEAENSSLLLSFRKKMQSRCFPSRRVGCAVTRLAEAAAAL
jgi:hypothetical protein